AIVVGHVTRAWDSTPHEGRSWGHLLGENVVRENVNELVCVGKYWMDAENQKCVVVIGRDTGAVALHLLAVGDEEEILLFFCFRAEHRGGRGRRGSVWFVGLVVFAASAVAAVFVGSATCCRCMQHEASPEG